MGSRGDVQNRSGGIFQQAGSAHILSVGCRLVICTSVQDSQERILPKPRTDHGNNALSASSGHAHLAVLAATLGGKGGQLDVAGQAASVAVGSSLARLTGTIPAGMNMKLLSRDLNVYAHTFYF